MNANDSGNNVLTYSAGGLPSGLTIDPNTGTISGTIAGTADVNSPYSVTVIATIVPPLTRAAAEPDVQLECEQPG